MQNKKNKKYFKAFTLVELIIVITILAILATIAFVSFSSYTASSRDTKRIVTIESIEKGLNIFQTQTGKYPVVENQSSTGIINSDTLSFVGQVGDNISRLINITPTPKDPVSGNNYVYATSFDQKYFQVAGTQEKPVAEKNIIDQTYANLRQAKVLGNYNGLLKKENKLYNLPSLIYTGSGYLVSNDTYFIVDKGQNIPYKIASTDPDNTITTEIILSQLTGTSAISLTGIIIPTTPGELKTNIDSVVQLLGYPGDKIGQETFGTQYFVANANPSSSSSSSSSGGGGGGNGFVCGGIVSALGENYTTKLMGDNSCWTTENIRHEINGCLGGGLCSYYGNNSSNKSTFGMLYDITSAISVCDSLGAGWHLPTDSEFASLEQFYNQTGAQCVIGRFVYDCDGAGWLGGNKLGGLVSYLGGYNFYGSFNFLNTIGFYRTSTDDGYGSYVYRAIRSDNSKVLRDSDGGGDEGYSVVCKYN